jgi:hypothetical protein
MVEWRGTNKTTLESDHQKSSIPGSEKVGEGEAPPMYIKTMKNMTMIGP